MSDHSISIVPKTSVYPGNISRADEILKWLVQLDLVRPTISDCVLSSRGGYAISEGARLITREPIYLPFSLRINGLEILTTRTIFDTGENGIEELICPNCHKDIANESWEFIDEWLEHASNNLTCPLCEVGSEIHQFQFTPEWGFSDLGFTFWNWPRFTESFLEEFRIKLGCEFNLVYSRI